MQIRTDIQALRGVAVLLVVLHHAGIGPFKAGHLGVDVFFVISGFLMTSIITESIRKENFSFGTFYFRRAKRLLPAALATFLATALCAPFLLDATELDSFGRQLVGALTFTGNIALFLQADYFGGEAQLKPLLHVWSLAIEEQFYLILPAALALTPRRFWLRGVVGVLLASFLLCLVGLRFKPVATFYLLPTRAWELCIGAAGALVVLQPHLQAAVRVMFWPAALSLIAVPVWPTGLPHPGADAAIVCVSTLLVILRQHPVTAEPWWLRGLARVGNFSYSLYLAHWPVFAFINNFYLGDASAMRWLGLLVSLVLGLLLYRTVETPIRSMNFSTSRRLIASAVASSLAIAAIPFGFASTQSHKNYGHVRRSNFGLGEKCVFTERFKPLAECRTSPAPRLLVWGDSFAMHLVEGLSATTDAGLEQATRSACAPIVGMALTYTGVNRKQAEKCIEFNESVVDYLAAADSIEVVVISSPFSAYLSDTHLGTFFHALVKDGDRFTERSPDAETALAHLLQTAQRVRALGKRVIVVAPPPAVRADMSRCLERRASGKPILGVEADCSISADEYRQTEQRRLDFLHHLPQTGIDVIWIDDILCRDGRCITQLDGTFIYRDRVHLSYDGSRLIGKKMQLASLVWERAR